MSPRSWMMVFPPMRLNGSRHAMTRAEYTHGAYHPRRDLGGSVAMASDSDRPLHRTTFPRQNSILGSRTMIVHGVVVEQTSMDGSNLRRDLIRGRRTR